MKILVVVPALGPIYGGPSKCVIELAQALGKQNIFVDIVTTIANGATNLDVPINIWIEEKFYRLQYFNYLNFADYKFSWSLTRWLYGNIKNYDLVHTNAVFSYPVLPAHWACQLHHVPYIMTPHGMLDPWALAYKSLKKRLYFDLLEKPALNKASAIQMLASTEANRVKPLKLNTPMVVIPNGIHPEDFFNLPNAELFYQHFPHTRNKQLILFLGRLDPKKGIDLLALAFSQIYQTFPDIHLIIAGPDNIGYLPTAQNYFKSLGCLESVTFTGMLTGDLKYSALKAATIYVLPSYSEGFSVSVLEAMAARLPCVITTGCNFPEAEIAEAALVVDIDAEHLKKALIWCLENPQEAIEMGDRASKFIFQNYTTDSIAAKLIALYNSIKIGQKNHA